MNYISTKRTITYVLLGCSIVTFLFSCKHKKPPLFELLDFKKTNINFENTLSPSDTLNILNFEYMFNGGGVGVGDINNDGLQDVFFSGNQVSSQLYLNQGNLKFEDITTSAGVTTNKWINGVTMTDINQDELLDIYLSVGGPRGTKENEMANLAFINQGNGTFKEKGKDLGIADTGYSVQALFFDYDKDGYTDLYVLTNALVSYKRNTTKPKLTNSEAESTDQLYKNNGDGTFSNVSKEAGITIEGFGLGVSSCDFNQDGWLDIYVSNDFLTNDILYINNGDGTFSNKISDYIKHQSFNGMGLNISDINNDGLSDIVVLDMLPQDNKHHKQTVGNFSYDKYKLNTSLGYTPQYVRNTLQLNNGNGTFSEIGQLAGIHNTDWSWSPLIADFDNDGWKDIFITNGYRRDVTNLDFIIYNKQTSPFGTKEAYLKNKLKKLEQLPEVKLHNYIYKNNGDLTFSDKVKDWGISTPSYSNGAAYADLDNDGDLDLVINNIDDKAHIYKNNIISSNDSVINKNSFLRIKLAGTTTKIGTQVIIHNNNKKQQQFFSPVNGYLSNMEPILHFGLGDAKSVDSLEVKWPDGTLQSLKNVTANQVLTLHQNNASTKNKKQKETSVLFEDVATSLDINYIHEEDEYIDFKTQATLLQMNSKLGPGITVGDINGDAIDDFYIGGAHGSNGAFFTQQTNGTFKKSILEEGEAFEDMGALLLDTNGDNHLDLLLISGGGKPKGKNPKYTDRLYINDGTGNFKKQTLFERTESGSCIKASDFDKDGDLDLFIGGRFIDGSYPIAPKSYILENNNGNYSDSTQKILGENSELGMVTDAIWTDFNNDQWIDLIIVGEYMSPKFFKNNKGILADVTSSTGLDTINGWWNSITAGDFDNDGDMDYILGNLGENSTHKASTTEPLTIYAKDFDKNGSIDPLISSYKQGEEHLVHARDVLIKQINAMRGRFKTYESYATAPLNKAFLKSELADAYTLKANMFSSSYVENLGNGKFKIIPLPIQAQFAPVFGVEIQDYNNDGNLDALLVGNFYSTEALTGQYDAMSGLCLLGNGKGEFVPVTAMESGLKINDDAKGLVQLQAANGNPIILASQNSGPLKAYTYKSETKTIKIAPNDAYAIIYKTDGTFYKKEFNYGSSYLSHSSRHLNVKWNLVDRVEIFSYTGEVKKIKNTDEQ